MLRNNLVAIIQARMNSRRLPDKVMREINGKPMLWHVIENVRIAIPQVIVTTPDGSIAQYATSQGIDAYVGSEEDVLDRYYQTARYFKVSNIVRITADNPLIRPETIQKVISVYLNGEYDWVGNCRLKVTYPIGDDVEVFSFKALEGAWQKATESYDREHVTPYIYNHPELFRLGIVENDRDLSHIRWTVDTLEDLEYVRNMLKEV